MTGERKLVGHDNFVRFNPMSDKFDVKRFHHIEFYCSDATNCARRHTWGFGMPEVAKSDLCTGNKHYASYVVKSNDIVYIFTAPFNNPDVEGSVPPHPGFNADVANKFVIDHGMAVRAIGMSCADARVAYETCVANGGIGVCAPVELVDRHTGEVCVISEIKLVGDTVLRWISGNFSGPFIPNYEPVKNPPVTYGLTRIDHIVCNVPKLFEAVDYIMGATGFHEFSEFIASEIGTKESGLNSMVLANNSEFILMPVNEPTFGTVRKSQIQTFLECNNGAGVQHIAVLTQDIFATMRELRQRSFVGGFEFMPAPGPEYYARVPERIGENTLTPEQFKEVETLGLLADRDDQGVLLQVFTKPLGDRNTIFVEIIQRIGCDVDEQGKPQEQSAGCGGFGKGNFSELFRSIEEFEKEQEAAVAALHK